MKISIIDDVIKIHSWEKIESCETDGRHIVHTRTDKSFIATPSPKFKTEIQSFVGPCIQEQSRF